eukprot:TRINITY_DN31231_c0_g1_i1.p1 TRINITY_DN31231_c0_g1~~TRINITY_DN31231_c0_g1_i1.p1  ORF type:complete len:586 (+),score=92.55 TRINITY_DN31231_c0_g1_i1:41-1759(+)
MMAMATSKPKVMQPNRRIGLSPSVKVVFPEAKVRSGSPSPRSLSPKVISKATRLKKVTSESPAPSARVQPVSKKISGTHSPPSKPKTARLSSDSPSGVKRVTSAYESPPKSSSSSPKPSARGPVDQVANARSTTETFPSPRSKFNRLVAELPNRPLLSKPTSSTSRAVSPRGKPGIPKVKSQILKSSHRSATATPISHSRIPSGSPLRGANTSLTNMSAFNESPPGKKLSAARTPNSSFKLTQSNSSNNLSTTSSAKSTKTPSTNSLAATTGRLRSDSPSRKNFSQINIKNLIGVSSRCKKPPMPARDRKRTTLKRQQPSASAPDDLRCKKEFLEYPSKTRLEVIRSVPPSEWSSMSWKKRLEVLRKTSKTTTKSEPVKKVKRSASPRPNKKGLASTQPLLHFDPIEVDSPKLERDPAMWSSGYSVSSPLCPGASPYKKMSWEYEISKGEWRAIENSFELEFYYMGVLGGRLRREQVHALWIEDIEYDISFSQLLAYDRDDPTAEPLSLRRRADTTPSSPCDSELSGGSTLASEFSYLRRFTFGGERRRSSAFTINTIPDEESDTANATNNE